MSVLFRADTSRKIGFGHISRCLALAERLRQLGIHVTFSCSNQIHSSSFAIKDEKVSLLPTEYLDDHDWDWLVIDHYGLDREFETQMRARVKRILVIDDLADRAHDCDVLLDQNLYDDAASRYENLVPKHCKLLLGPQFSLLQSAFREAREGLRRANGFRRLLVSFGGSDPTNETSKVLHAIRLVSRRKFQVDVLMGRWNANQRELQSIARNMPGVVLHENTDRVADLMRASDVAIGAGGTTTWERCCLGLPSITMAVADNQVAICETLAHQGYQTYLGRAEGVSISAITETLRFSSANFSAIREMGLKSMELVDGRGSDRVAEVMRAI